MVPRTKRFNTKYIDLGVDKLKTGDWILAEKQSPNKFNEISYFQT